MREIGKKIAFFGTYYQVLEVVHRRLGISLVVVESGKISSEVKNFCRSNNIRCVEIVELDDSIDELRLSGVSIGIVASFGLIFKTRHINLFSEIFNFHPGCIFTNRGRHPLPNAIRLGMKNMSISLHKITDENIDAGEFIAKFDLPINYDRGYSWNQDCLLASLPWLAMHLCDVIATGNLSSYRLPLDDSNYYPPMTKEDLVVITRSDCLKEWKA